MLYSSTRVVFPLGKSLVAPYPTPGSPAAMCGLLSAIAVRMSDLSVRLVFSYVIVLISCNGLEGTVSSNNLLRLPWYSRRPLGSVARLVRVFASCMFYCPSKLIFILFCLASIIDERLLTSNIFKSIGTYGLVVLSSDLFSYPTLVLLLFSSIGFMSSEIY